MMNIDTILSLLNLIANNAKTGYPVERIAYFINTNIHEIIEESRYINQMNNGLMNKNGRRDRCQTGKFERELTNMLYKLCNWRANKYLTTRASKVMTLLGYKSYKKNPNRFKQMMENRKKLLHKKQKLNRLSNERLEAADEEQVENESVHDVVSENEVHDAILQPAPENLAIEEEREVNNDKDVFDGCHL